MAEEKDHVLVIDGNDDEREMLVELALEPFGYEVRQASDGNRGLAMIQEQTPDILLLDLHVEGLSGQDILAALNSQSLDIPVILLANEGSEREALQAFRLGAKDYVVRPFREAELIQVLERALKEVRLKRERSRLLDEVQESVETTKKHISELKTLRTIGKSITMLRGLDEVFQQVIRAAVQLTGAESAGLFMKDDKTDQLILRAGKKLLPELAIELGSPVKDDLAGLVMSTRDTFAASGEGLKRYKPAHSGATAVVYAPLSVHESAIGVLWVANETKPFAEHMSDLLTALADYAAIAVFNARLFATMQERTRQLETVTKKARTGTLGGDPRYAHTLRVIQEPLAEALRNMMMFKSGDMGRLTSSHQAAVDVMYRQLEELTGTVNNTLKEADDQS